MATGSNGNSQMNRSSETLLHQKVLGSRKNSNYLTGSVISVGGIGFLLASLSSYRGQDLLPIGHPSELIFVPQGLIMGLYAIAALLMAIYLWGLVLIDFGSGNNSFDKKAGIAMISRRGLLKEFRLDIPHRDIKAVKLEVREGINPRRRISLRIQGGRDVPLTGVGSPLSLVELEKQGAELARFLGVSLEGV